MQTSEVLIQLPFICLTLKEDFQNVYPGEMLLVRKKKVRTKSLDPLLERFF